MTRPISERIRSAAKVLGGSIDLTQMVPVTGYFDVRVVRADGSVEEKTLRNTVTVVGLNRIAAASVNSASAVMQYIVVGTATGAPALTDSQSSIGEVGRKQFISTGANAQSREWIFGVATWGGAADSVTSVTIDSAGLSSDASSATASTLFNRVNGINVTLANSDFLNLTVRIRVGSHNVAHST